MNWETLLDDYLTWMASHYATATVRCARPWLCRFQRFCEGWQLAEPASVTPEHVLHYHQELLWRQGRDGLLAPRTVDLALRMVRSFYRWAVHNDRLLLDPTRHLTLPRVDTSQSRVPTRDEVDRVLRAPDVKTVTGLRDCTILELCYGTGLRAGECSRLNLQDVQLPTRQVILHGSKDTGERLVAMGNALGTLLERYLQLSRPSFPNCDDSNALFLTRHGNRISIHALQNLFAAHSRHAGVARLSMQSLRRACASHLLEGGAKLEDIQQLFGHRSPVTTAEYIQVLPAELRRLLKQSHPRA